MKIKIIGGIAIIRGKPDELKPLELLCDGTHHIHKNPTGRSEKYQKTCGTCRGWSSIEGITTEGDCSRGRGVNGITNIYDVCDEWRER